MTGRGAPALLFLSLGCPNLVHAVRRVAQDQLWVCLHHMFGGGVVQTRSSSHTLTHL